MRKDIYFDNFVGPGWPTLDELRPYFLAPPGKEWFYTGGNDSGGGVPRRDWFSKGDMTKLRTWVRSLHDTPLPVGLFVPFPIAWKAVEEFMETEGKLPTSIAWAESSDLPDGTFPDP